MVLSRSSSVAASLLIAGMSTAIGAAAPSPAPYASSVQHLQHRMQIMLKGVVQSNEQTEVTLEPDQSGLRTIVRIRVHPANGAELRSDLTKSVNEYIDIHKGDCRPNTIAQSTNTIPLNPISNGVSTTTVDVPISTLLGHGNVVTTRTSNGTIVDCGALGG